jgi:pyruvate dehydrogenase E2 component (dihydrolipoamide acetyltransferase)
MAEAIIMPKTGMAMTEGTIIEWHKKVGEPIEQGDVLAEIETDKSTMELEADYSGYLLAILYPNGSVVPVTVSIGWIGAKGEKVPGTPPATAVQRVLQQDNVPIPLKIASYGRIQATPAARRVATERTISLAKVIPSGKSGEIVLRDVMEVRQIKATPLATRMAEDRGVDLAEVTKEKFFQWIYRWLQI